MHLYLKACSCKYGRHKKGIYGRWGRLKTEGGSNAVFGCQLLFNLAESGIFLYMPADQVIRNTHWSHKVLRNVPKLWVCDPKQLPSWSTLSKSCTLHHRTHIVWFQFHSISRAASIVQRPPVCILLHHFRTQTITYHACIGKYARNSNRGVMERSQLAMPILTSKFQLSR